MSRRQHFRWTFYAAALCVLPATTAAQAGTSPHAEDARPRLSGTISLAQFAQKVPVMSPVTYDGTGVGVALRWDRRSAASATDATIEFFSTDLAGKGIPDGLSASHVLLGTVLLTHTKALHQASTAVIRPYLGMRLEATIHGDEHRYGAMRQGTRDAFGYAAITAGPAARFEFSTGAGRWSEEVSVPIVGVAQIPYVNAKAEEHLRLRGVTIAELQSLRQRLSYHRRFTGGWAFIWAYDLSLMRQSRYDVRRYARQGLSTSISLPVGRRRS